MLPEVLIRALLDKAFHEGDLSELDESIHPEYQYTSTDSSFLQAATGVLFEVGKRV